MNNVLKEIKVITRKDFAGLTIPMKILIIDEDGPKQYTVSRIIRRDNERIDGHNTTMYTCLVEQNMRTLSCDIRFYHDEKKWYLYRI